MIFQVQVDYPDIRYNKILEINAKSEEEAEKLAMKFLEQKIFESKIKEL